MRAEREVGSAERELWAAVLARETLSVSGWVEEEWWWWWRVAGADCLRRKKGRDSEKRTMAALRCCCYLLTMRSPRDEMTGIAVVGGMAGLVPPQVGIHVGVCVRV